VRKIYSASIVMVVLLSAGLAFAAPIHDAAAKGDYNKVESLLRTGVAVDTQNERGQTAMNIAAGYGHYGLVNLLLQWGANPNIVDKNGFNPTDAAKFNGKTNVDELLRKHGGKYHYKASWNP